MRSTAELALRALISEVINVTIKRPSGGSYTAKIDDEHEDEVIWLVDKYGHKIHSKGTKGAHAQLTAIAEALAALSNNPMASAPSWTEDLVAAVEPWGREGFDALRRVKIVSERTGAAFPFLESPSPTHGSTLELPKLPSPATVEFLKNVQPRIGRNDTGKGEFLLALMTGGIAGTGPGDITIDGKNWEVKDEGAAGSPVRLGDDVSKRFVADIRSRFGGTLPPGVSFEKFLAELDAFDFVDELRESNPWAASVLDSALITAAAEGIDGYALLQAEGSFVFVAANRLRFYNITPSLRVHVARVAAPFSGVVPPDDSDVWPEFKGADVRRDDREERRRSLESIATAERRKKKADDARIAAAEKYEAARKKYDADRAAAERAREEWTRRKAAGEAVGPKPRKFDRQPPVPPAGFSP